MKWLDRNEYSFQSRYWKVNGYNLHYIDEGVGDPILFVHGTPSWSFDFRNVIKNLQATHRCIALDHIGFGLSDKPETYDYSTQNHSETLAQFITALNLHNIILVLHDFGGPIGFQVALRFPERVKKMVILNSWLWSSASDPDFVKLSRILKNPLLPFLYRYLNFSPRFILPQSFGDKKLNPKLRSQYTKPFANKAERNGALAFARSLLNDQAWFETLWYQREIFKHTPILFIWGMKDPVIKPHYLQKFVAGFPNGQVHQLETSGHFPQEEEPEKVSKAIGDFINRTT